jgi:transposase
MKSGQEKYKYTKQLLKLAIEAGGYSNKEIAKKARISEKSVKMPSLWRNGKAQATVAQMNYFIQNYEYLLKRKIEHLFYTQTLEDGSECLRFKTLTGDILFKYQIKIKKRNAYPPDKGTSILRIIILNQGEKYHFIQQYRARSIALAEKAVDEKKVVYASHLQLDEAIKSDNEDGNWFYYSILEDIDFDEVVRNFQSVKDNLLGGRNIIDTAYRDSRSSSSQFFNGDNIHPMEFAFYQTVMKMNLHSELLPY